MTKLGKALSRSRTAQGTVSRKKGNTFVATVEKTYKRDFNVRGDMHLKTFLKKGGYDSLSKLLKAK